MDLWYPPGWLTHVNNLLMVLAFYLLCGGWDEDRDHARMRHPQLTAFKTWAVAHLLVNGDLASRGAVRRAAGLGGGGGDRDQPRPAGLDAKAGAKPGADVEGGGGDDLVVVVVIMLIHNWLGVQPWGG